MEDDFALRYVRIYPGVNSRAELVTLAPGLFPFQRKFWLYENQINSLKNEPAPQYKLEIGKQIVTKYCSENRVSELSISPNRPSCSAMIAPLPNFRRVDHRVTKSRIMCTLT